MSLGKNVCKVLLIETLFAFIVCLICGFIFFKAPDLVLINPMLYKFQSGILLFFTLLPAIFIAGIIVGFSWAFGKEKGDTSSRFSSVFASYLKSVFITSIICMSLCFIGAEVVNPLIIHSRERVVENSQNIDEYMNLAQESIDKKDYGSAFFYIYSVLDLSPKMEEANNVLAYLEKVTSIESDNKVKDKEKDFSVPDIVPDSSSLTIPDLMIKARDNYTKGNYFDAHYYASQVLAISSSTDGNRSAAQQIASDAWNKLSEMEAFEDDVSREVFKTKKEGYTALISGDYSKSYYIFKKLLDKYPLDYDVKKYYQMARDLLSTRYFFIDETQNLKQFEQYRNVYFTLPRMDGGRDLISIRGITTVKDSGKLINYLRGFSVISYDNNNEILMKLSVPYAKLCPAPLDSLGENLINYVNKKEKTNFVPYVFLRSVDSVYEDIFIEPKIETRAGYKSPITTTYIMPIPFDSFTMLCDVSHGSETMPLASLFKFSKQASDYGYSTEIYSQSLISRLTYPLLLLICFVISCIISWGSRLFSKVSFRFSWLGLFPLFTFFAYISLNLLEYILTLLSYAVLAFAGSASLTICIAVLLIILILVVLRFVSLKSDN